MNTKIFVLVMLCAEIFINSCSSSEEVAPTLTMPPESQSTPTAQIAVTSPGGLCQGERQQTMPGYSLKLAGASAEMLWQTIFVPWWVRTGADGKVYAVSDGGDSIYEIKPDGTLTEAFTCPGVQIETGIMASDGAFWFATRDGGRLYRVDPDGSVKILAQNGNRNLEAGPDGSVYRLENGLDRVDADGTQTQITKELNGRKFAISPNGEIAAMKDGRVMLVSENGEMRELAAGYGPEEWLAFGPDGNLYVTHWSGVDVIDLAAGSLTPIDWLVNAVPGESGAFAPDGHLLVYHPNTNVFAIDLQARTVETYYQVLSNSWAMGVNPQGEVYMAFGSKQPDGGTGVYRVLDRQTLELIGTVPYRYETSMVFGLDGMGYLGVGDPEKGGMIYSFNPGSGSFEEYFQPDCWPNTMAVNPLDGRMWWGECENFNALDETGQKETLPGVPESENSSLAITTGGEFYALVFFHRADPNTPYKHAIYHLNSGTQQWEEVADITQSDPGITMAKITGCVNGQLYTVESLGPESLSRGYSSYNGVRRLEADGSLTLVGFDFAYDGQAAACDYVNNRLIFTSGAGIFAVKLP